MPVVRQVTQEEIQAAADAEGFVVAFTKPHHHKDRQSFTVKSQLVVTTTRKGERVEEVVEWKPNDCEPFRWILVGLYGDRKGFRYTTSNTMYDGNGEEIKAVPKERPAKVLTKDHLAALQEGRKRAREAAKQIPEPVAPKVVTVESDGNELFKAGFYSSPCRECGKGISRTGRKGRAPTTHKAAKETCP